MSTSWAHLQLVHTNPGSAWRKTPAGLVSVPVDFVPEGDWGAHLDECERCGVWVSRLSKVRGRSLCGACKGVARRRPRPPVVSASQMSLFSPAAGGS